MLSKEALRELDVWVAIHLEHFVWATINPAWEIPRMHRYKFLVPPYHSALGSMFVPVPAGTDLPLAPFTYRRWDMDVPRYTTNPYEALRIMEEYAPDWIIMHKDGMYTIRDLDEHTLLVENRPLCLAVVEALQKLNEAQLNIP